MPIPRIVARLGSATLLGVLAFSMAGVGTAAAANATDEHASISVATTPAAAAQVWPGKSFTDTFVISDPNSSGTHDVSVRLAYPSTLQLQTVQFNRDGAWVDSTTANDFGAKLGDIGSHGGSVTMSVIFRALAGYTGGAPLQGQLEDTWQSNTSSANHHGMSSVPLLVSGPMQPSMAVGTPSNGVVTVSSRGFQPGEAVNFWYNLPNGTAAALYVRNGALTTSQAHRNANPDANGNRDVDNATALSADSNGQINISFATGGLPAGAYSIVAHGLTSGVDYVVPFTT